MVMLVMAGFSGLGAAPAAAAPDDVTATEVSFEGNGGVVLHGTILAGASAAGRRPAMVMVQGAGNRGRQVIRPDAEAYARLGLVVLIYDKRTAGYSLFHRDYSVLADDALAGLRLLAARPDVDPARLGLWGASEGAFVAPLAAARSADVRYVIAVGAAGVAPAVQARWEWGEYLRHFGVSGSLTRTMQGPAFRTVVGAGLFAEAGFDPSAAWRQVRQPVLAEWGEMDHDVMPELSARLIAEALHDAGNTHATIRTVPGVRHNLHLTANGGYDHLDAVPPDYGRYESAWIDAPAPTAAELPAGGGPIPAVAPLRWYDSFGLQAAGFALLVLGFAAFPLTAAFRRLRGHRFAPTVRRPARWLAGAGLAATLGGPLYLLFMMAIAAQVVGPTLLGRPLPWLLLQLLALGTVAALVATVIAWRRHRAEISAPERARLGLLVTAGTLFLPLAVHWGLLAG
ncbi:alpha/beta hydrolase [Dactylosporangium salmoneum]|uniref:Alpha/beta hydrolase n=2 Tax=Dactylosporangium salmoneum TaxID=53361 RepID=A0ABP5UTR5_9ACTN